MSIAIYICFLTCEVRKIAVSYHVEKIVRLRRVALIRNNSVIIKPNLIV